MLNTEGISVSKLEVSMESTSADFELPRSQLTDSKMFSRSRYITNNTSLPQYGNHGNAVSGVTRRQSDSCGHLDFESAATAQNDVFKGSF